ncbi:hypothetical protein NC653_015047 [Populus alba x Populus x berolinensis]|uniref:Uncharacterized protein n=1 Tax=Populus alba x Populus x berolinensis TaxID=444605 RepID=A0AAD6QYX5_9ROSI|nr:hypothetical protein NC653_015047 [Populus alba x Populus x berolinensis]
MGGIWSNKWQVTGNRVVLCPRSHVNAALILYFSHTTFTCPPPENTPEAKPGSSPSDFALADLLNMQQWRALQELIRVQEWCLQHSKTYVGVVELSSGQ